MGGTKKHFFKTSLQRFWLRSSLNSKWWPPFFCAIFCEKNRYFWMKPIKQLDWPKKNESIVIMIANIFNHRLFWKKNGKASSLDVLSLKTFNSFVFQNFASIITITLRVNGKKKDPQKKYFFSLLEISNIILWP